MLTAGNDGFLCYIEEKNKIDNYVYNAGGEW